MPYSGQLERCEEEGVEELPGMDSQCTCSRSCLLPNRATAAWSCWRFSWCIDCSARGAIEKDMGLPNDNRPPRSKRCTPSICQCQHSERRCGRNLRDIDTSVRYKSLTRYYFRAMQNIRYGTFHLQSGGLEVHE